MDSHKNYWNNDKTTFKEGNDFKIYLYIVDRSTNKLRDCYLCTMVENLYISKFLFDIHHIIAYNLGD